ncbi:MAG: transcription-repair coupling factor, partial [Treponema sp.]|nr:transcription-repair coupling factor [Treponema sp.]
MKSLSSSVNNFLHNWPEFYTAADTVTSLETAFPVQIEGIQGCLFSFFLSELCSARHIKILHEKHTVSSDLLIVVPGEYEMNSIQEDIKTIFPDTQVFTFPNWGTIPYRPAARGSIVFGQRAGFLSELCAQKSFSLQNKPRIFILTQRAFISPLPPPQYIKQFTFTLKKKDSLDTVKIAARLTQIGYTRVSRVNVRGEFSLRGEVLDIFLPLEDNPIRIVFDFDTIESIKQFEADSQTTTGTLDKITIYPMKEVLWEQELINTFTKKMEEYQNTAIQDNSTDINTLQNNTVQIESNIHLPFTEHAYEYFKMMAQELEAKHETEGEELFYNLLWDKNYTIRDYIDENTLTLIYDYDRQQHAEEAIWREFSGMYRKTRETFPSLPPDHLLLNYNNTLESLSKCLLFRTLETDKSTSDANKSNFFLKINSEPGRSFFGNINYMKEELTNLQNDGWNIFIYTDNENQQLRIHEIFKDWTDIDARAGIKPVVLIPKPVSSGFNIPQIKLLVIQENEIFGRRKYVAKSVNKAKSKAIDTFVELNPGDYVVH